MLSAVILPSFFPPPPQPVPLSLTHSATPEDLKKDREAAAAKLKYFLSDEDEGTLQRRASL